MKSPTGLDATFTSKDTRDDNACRLVQFMQAARKLVFIPLDLGHPLWVQVDSVDISFHRRRADLANQSAKNGGLPIMLAPPTPFNAGITKARNVVTAAAPLAECMRLS